MDETAAPAPPAPPAGPRSIGERLRAGRERAGLSIAAAAEKLHLDPKVIESLEADRFAELGASVYVRGHLRRYADFVGEPGAEMVSSYTARDVRPPPPDLTQVPHPDRRSDPRRLVTPLVGLACAAVLLLAIWWVLAGSRSGTESRRRARAGRSRPRKTSPAPDAEHRCARRRRPSAAARSGSRYRCANANRKRRPSRARSRRERPVSSSISPTTAGSRSTIRAANACSTTWRAPAACRA